MCKVYGNAFPLPGRLIQSLDVPPGPAQEPAGRHGRRGGHIEASRAVLTGVLGSTGSQGGPEPSAASLNN